MFAYYLDLALRSFKRGKALTILMVVLIGAGVAASMTTFAALRAVSGDPVPGKSEQLFVVQIDNQGPANRGADGEPSPFLSYIDATALLRSTSERHTAEYPVQFPVVPPDTSQAPFTIKGYATTADFFSMFDVPFRHGGSWPQHGGANDVVIGAALNRKLFGGANSIGRELRLGDHAYTVAGVLGDWNPQPRFYAGGDVNSVLDHGDEPELFMPLDAALASKVSTAGSMMCPSDYQGSGWNALLVSECDWMSVWVELPSAQEVRRYRSFLDSYAGEQQRIGRFGWAPNVRLRNLPQWLKHMHAVPQQNRIAFLLAIGLQVVCLLNTLGLLLAKFMRRHAEIGIRRALGASRRAIAAQFLTEAAMVGTAGGVLGLMLTAIGVSPIGSLFGPKIARLTQVDGALLTMVLLVSLVATVLTALYTVWRAARVQPALQLKAN